MVYRLYLPQVLPILDLRPDAARCLLWRRQRLKVLVLDVASHLLLAKTTLEGPGPDAASLLLWARATLDETEDTDAASRLL